MTSRPWTNHNIWVARNTENRFCWSANVVCWLSPSSSYGRLSNSQPIDILVYVLKWPVLWLCSRTVELPHWHRVHRYFLCDKFRYGIDKLIDDYTRLINSERSSWCENNITRKRMISLVCNWCRTKPCMDMVWSTSTCNFSMHINCVKNYNTIHAIETNSKKINQNLSAY